MSAADLKVSHPKELLKRIGGRGCVVIIFDDEGQFAVAEYGKDRQNCARLKKLVDAIHDKLAHGGLPQP